jgi:hypothetical protein
VGTVMTVIGLAFSLPIGLLMIAGGDVFRGVLQLFVAFFLVVSGRSTRARARAAARR